MTDTPSTREISPGLKMALELGPVAAFLAGYVWLRDRTFLLGGTEYDGFIIVTAAFVPVLMLSSFIIWKLTGKLSRMQILTLVLVVVFGGLTVWLNDERFFKMKPTIVFGLFAGLLAIGLMRGRSYLEWAMDGVMPLTHTGWMILTRRLAWFFAFLSASNEVIWRFMSTDIWVATETFGHPIAIFAFFITQSGLIEAHGIPEDGAEDDA